MKYIKKFEIDNGSSVEEYIPIPPIATSEVTGGIKASLRAEENVEAAIDENGSLFVPEYPSLDNKVNKNGYGEEDYGKVLETDNDGNVVLKEVKSASDNNPIGIVEKTLNPSVSDCFNSSIKNLKMYGQSTQGADPTPTNKQDITAISQFEGAPTSKNLLQGLQGGTFSTINGSFRSSTSNYANSNLYIRVIPNKYLVLSNINGKIALTSVFFYDENKNFIKVDQSWNPKVPLNAVYCNFSISKSSVNSLEDLQLEMSDTNSNPTTYVQYQSQPFTYTPSQKMYSTQDGSISDYVDVEKGVEVYNMIKQILTTENVWTQYTADDSTRPFGKCYTTTLEFPFVNYEVMCDYLPYIQFAWKNATKPSISLSNYGEKVWVLCVVEYETLEEFTQWLSSNPMTIFFQAQAPTETPIPQEQLAMLKALYTYTGVTNFLCNAPVSFTYEQSLQIIIDNILKSINNINANKLLLQGGM